MDRGHNFLGYELEILNESSEYIDIDSIQLNFEAHKLGAGACFASPLITDTYRIEFSTINLNIPLSDVDVEDNILNINGIVVNESEIAYRISGKLTIIGSCLSGYRWSFNLDVPVDMELQSQTNAKLTLLFVSPTNDLAKSNIEYFILQTAKASLLLQNGNVITSYFDGRVTDVLSMNISIKRIFSLP